MKYSDWARSQSLFLSERNRQTKKQKGTDGESRKELEKDQVKKHEIFRLGKKLISIFVWMKQQTKKQKGTDGERGKEKRGKEMKNDQVKEYEIFRLGKKLIPRKILFLS